MSNARAEGGWFSAPDISLFGLCLCLISVVAAIPLTIFSDAPFKMALWREVYSNSLMLIFYIHIAFGLYWGAINGRRWISWLGLTTSFLVMLLGGFAGYVLPWGQMQFWAMSVLPGWAEAGFPGFSVLLAALTVVQVLFLIWDAWLVYRPSWIGRTRRQFLRFGGCAAVVYLALWVMSWLRLTIAAAPEPSPFDIVETPAYIVPEWYFLPWYSILRVVPDKFGGVIAMFAVVSLPIFWPLMRVERLRTSVARRVWLAAWATFVVCVFVLGWLGAQPADQPYLAAGQVLTVLYFGFFLVVAPLLRATARPLV